MALFASHETARGIGANALAQAATETDQEQRSAVGLCAIQRDLLA
jgi:hypothetical protein